MWQKERQTQFFGDSHETPGLHIAGIAADFGGRRRRTDRLGPK